MTCESVTDDLDGIMKLHHLKSTMGMDFPIIDDDKTHTIALETTNAPQGDSSEVFVEPTSVDLLISSNADLLDTLENELRSLQILVATMSREESLDDTTEIEEELRDCNLPCLCPPGMDSPGLPSLIQRCADHPSIQPIAKFIVASDAPELFDNNIVCSSKGTSQQTTHNENTSNVNHTPTDNITTKGTITAGTITETTDNMTVLLQLSNAPNIFPATIHDNIHIGNRVINCTSSSTDVDGLMKLHDLKGWLMDMPKVEGVTRKFNCDVDASMRLHDIRSWLKFARTHFMAFSQMVYDRAIWNAWKCNISCILYAFVVERSFDMFCECLFTVFKSITTIKHRLIKHNGYFGIEFRLQRAE